MSARITKYTLLLPVVIILVVLGWPDAILGWLLVMLGVAFGLMWERYSSMFSLLQQKPKNQKGGW